MHILVLFWRGLSNLSVLIPLATPLIVLGAVVLPLLLKLTSDRQKREAAIRMGTAISQIAF